MPEDGSQDFVAMEDGTFVFPGKEPVANRNWSSSKNAFANIKADKH